MRSSSTLCQRGSARSAADQVWCGVPRRPHNGVITKVLTDRVFDSAEKLSVSNSLFADNYLSGNLQAANNRRGNLSLVAPNDNLSPIHKILSDHDVQRLVCESVKTPA